MSWRKIDSVNIAIVNPWHEISLMVPVRVVARVG
jgi:hypothetical protein